MATVGFFLATGALIVMMTNLILTLFIFYFLVIHDGLAIIWPILCILMASAAHFTLIYFISLWETTAKEEFSRNRLKQ